MHAVKLAGLGLIVAAVAATVGSESCGQKPDLCLETQQVHHPASEGLELDTTMYLITNVPWMKTVYYGPWTETVCVRYEDKFRY